MESHLKQQNNSNTTAFVLGNGTSRSTINPKKLIDLGNVYGCNAQYREYTPHFLVAVDVKMANEVIDSGYHKAHAVWTNPNKGVKTKDSINFFQPHKGWSSGPTALWFAATKQYKTIYILGFDFQGLNGKFNNVYADTINYKRSTEAATFFGNWLNQTEKVVKEYKHINFCRIIQPGNYVPEKLIAIKNLQHISYDDFKKQYPNTDFS